MIISISTFALVPLQSFGKTPPLVVESRRATLPRFIFVLAAGGKDTARYPPEITNVCLLSPPPPFQLSSHLRITYVRLLVAKNIREW